MFFVVVCTQPSEMDADQLAIDALVGRGYTLDQATQMHYQQKDKAEIAARAARNDQQYSAQQPPSRNGSISQQQHLPRQGSMQGGGGYSPHDSDYNDYAPQLQQHQHEGNSFSQGYNSNNMTTTHNQSFGASQGQSYVAQQNSYYDSEPRQQQRPHGSSFSSNNGGYAAPPPPYIAPPPRGHGPVRTADEHAMDIAMLISQQEAQFGISMYDSLTPADQPEIDAMMARGYSSDEAIQVLFDRRYNRNGGHGGGGFGQAQQQPLSRGGSGSGFDSYGGGIYECMGMVERMRHCPIPVHTVVESKAMSAGAFLFGMGTQRYMAKNAHLMIHDASQFLAGKAEELRAMAGQLSLLNKSMLRDLARHVGQPDDYFAKMIHDGHHAEVFLGARSARKHKLCTRIGIPSMVTEVVVRTRLAR